MKIKHELITRNGNISNGKPEVLKDKLPLLLLLHNQARLKHDTLMLHNVAGCCVVIVMSFVTGKAHDTEETVLADFFTGSAGKGKFPEGEK